MKKPKTLTDLIRLAIEHGWVEHEELVEISKELLDHMGPVKLDEIIREANRQKLERVWGMRAFQCSKCIHLHDHDDYCSCQIGIDIRPGHREKGEAELCKGSFRPLEPSEEWHRKFSWE